MHRRLAVSPTLYRCGTGAAAAPGVTPFSCCRFSWFAMRSRAASDLLRSRDAARSSRACFGGSLLVAGAALRGVWVAAAAWEGVVFGVAGLRVGGAAAVGSDAAVDGGRVGAAVGC